MKRRFSSILRLLPLLLVAAGTQTAAGSERDEKFSLSLGAAYLQGKVNATKSNNTIGTKSLGLDDNQTSFYLLGRWRFAENWLLGLEYYGITQDGSKTYSTDISFGDLVIPVGATANTEFDVKIYALTLGYSFLHNDRTELGLGLGLHIADLGATLSGIGNVGGATIPIYYSESADATAPLPNLRLYGSYEINPQWSLVADLGYFSLAYDKYDGRLNTATAAVKWTPFKRVGFGLGYTYFDIDLDVDQTASTDNYNLTVDGPTLFVTGHF